MSFFRALLATTLLMGLLVSACASAATDMPIPVSGGSMEPQFADFDPANFSDSANIDNAWMPMRPGAKWVYEGKALDDEGNPVERRIEFTVTDLTKVIAGVRTVVAWIEDFDDGEVIEKEIAFYAQDNDGNVWYLGEHPEEIDNGKFVAAPTWIVGIAEARAGVKMWAEPKLGGPVVYQGWGPAVEWSDYGRVDQVGQETCVPLDCYTDVLVNAESSLGEEGAYQLKYYARGVGEIRVGWKGEDTAQEELELVELGVLTPAELEAVRAEAIELEQHAYEISDVYKQTSPSEYPSGTPVLQVGSVKPATPAMQALEIIVYTSRLRPGGEHTD